MEQHHAQHQYTCRKRAQQDKSQNNSIDYYSCVHTVQKFIYKTYAKQYVQSKANMKEISNIYMY